MVDERSPRVREEEIGEWGRLSLDFSTQINSGFSVRQ